MTLEEMNTNVPVASFGLDLLTVKALPGKHKHLRLALTPNDAEMLAKLLVLHAAEARQGEGVYVMIHDGGLLNPESLIVSQAIGQAAVGRMSTDGGYKR